MSASRILTSRLRSRSRRSATVLPSRPSAHRTRPTVEFLDARVVPTGGLSASYAVTQDWGTGFQAQMSLNNAQATNVANWKLEFDLGASISSIWNASIVGHSGNHYVIEGASWDSTLPAAGSVSFGFVASPGHVAAPANEVLNGVPLG